MPTTQNGDILCPLTGSANTVLYKKEPGVDAASCLSKNLHFILGYFFRTVNLIMINAA